MYYSLSLTVVFICELMAGSTNLSSDKFKRS